MTRRRGLALTAAAAAVLGCGLPAGCSAPDAGSAGSPGSTGSSGARSLSAASATAASSGVDRAGSAASTLATAQRTHEYPGPAPRRTAPSGAANPVFVLQAFGTAYINWTAASVSATMRALTQISVGQARSEVALAAAQTARDYELKRGEIANAGVVEAIAPMLGGGHEYAVVTRERTTSARSSAYQGLPPAWHLALATVTRLRPGQWVVSSWQPEN